MFAAAGEIKRHMVGHSSRTFDSKSNKIFKDIHVTGFILKCNQNLSTLVAMLNKETELQQQQFHLLPLKLCSLHLKVMHIQSFPLKYF